MAAAAAPQWHGFFMGNAPTGNMSMGMRLGTVQSQSGRRLLQQTSPVKRQRSPRNKSVSPKQRAAASSTLSSTSTLAVSARAATCCDGPSEAKRLALQAQASCLVAQAEAAVAFDPSKGSGGPPVVRKPSGQDLCKPVYVDCSVEYDMPNIPKIPRNSQPLLAIPAAWRNAQHQHSFLLPHVIPQQRMMTMAQLPQPQHVATYPCAQCVSASAASVMSRKRDYSGVMMASHHQLQAAAYLGGPQQQPQHPMPAPARPRVCACAACYRIHTVRCCSAPDQRLVC
jgi:hypothetical protein